MNMFNMGINLKTDMTLHKVPNNFLLITNMNAIKHTRCALQIQKKETLSQILCSLKFKEYQNFSYNNQHTCCPVCPGRPISPATPFGPIYVKKWRRNIKKMNEIFNWC